MVNDYYKLIRVERDKKKALDISYSRINSVDLYDGRITIKYDKSGKVIFRGDNDKIKTISKELLKEPTITVTTNN